MKSRLSTRRWRRGWLSGRDKNIVPAVARFDCRKYIAQAGKTRPNFLQEVILKCDVLSWELIVWVLPRKR
jgi:hypothetical protein